MTIHVQLESDRQLRNEQLYSVGTIPDDCTSNERYMSGEWTLAMR